jgi:hypothetical protein
MINILDQRMQNFLRNQILKKFMIFLNQNDLS